MNKDDVVQFLAQSSDPVACAEIERKAKERRIELRDAAYRAQVAEYWSRVVYFHPGQTLYCAAENTTFIGGPFQRGDKCAVHDVESERRKILWIKVGKDIIGLDPFQVYRYRLQTKRPEKPLSKLDRQMAKTLSKVTR